MKSIETPVIRGIKLKPLNTFRWSRIKTYMVSKQGEIDETIHLILAYATLAMASDERSLHIYSSQFEDAIVDTGLTLDDEELAIVSDYISAVINAKEDAEVVVENDGKKS